MGQPWGVISVHRSGECDYVIYVSQNKINQSINQSISQRSFTKRRHTAIYCKFKI